MLRQRSRRACGPCRKRKVKCNGYYPCDVCEGYGYQCDFAEDPKRPAKRARTEESTPETALQETSTSGLNHEHHPANKDPELSTTTQSNVGVQREPPDNERSFMLVEVPNRMKHSVLPSSPLPDSLMTRFTTVYSAVAFPRELGQSLLLSEAPRLHPFAWNTGTREERQPNLANRVFDQISLQDAIHYANIYFDVVHPWFGMMSPTHFTKTCTLAWNTRQMAVDIEAMYCSVIALGSLFSPASSTPWTMEAWVVEQTRVLLDNNVSSSSQLSVKFVLAWLFRAVYLRCTTRPHLSWIATCNAMHVAEAIGLHQDFRNMDVLSEKSREAAVKEKVGRRKIFWLAVSFNRLFSIEYGRTPVHIDSISCSRIESGSESNGTEPDLAADFVQLCQLLPKNHHDPKGVAEEKEDLAANLRTLAAHHTTTKVPTPILLSPTPPPPLPIALLKAEICFAIFRKMRFLHMTLTIPQTETVVRIIRAALLEAQTLATIFTSKWWNVISVPFHSVGVLIAIGSNAALGLLLVAMRALRVVVRAYDTHLAREALETAEVLVRGCRERKLEEAGWVGEALEVDGGVGLGSTDGRKDVQRQDQIAHVHLHTTLPTGPTPNPTPVPAALLSPPPAQQNVPNQNQNLNLGLFDWPSEDDGGWMEIFFDGIGSGGGIGMEGLNQPQQAPQPQPQPPPTGVVVGGGGGGGGGVTDKNTGALRLEGK